MYDSSSPSPKPVKQCRGIRLRNLGADKVDVNGFLNRGSFMSPSSPFMPGGASALSISFVEKLTPPSIQAVKLRLQIITQI